MDATLIERCKRQIAEPSKAPDVRVAFINGATGEIELIQDDRREPYTLKPLGELYGTANAGTVDPQSKTFMRLFFCIEEEIVRFDDNERRLTDGEIALALNNLSMNPEASAADPLMQKVQCALRMLLSLNNYSRQEVRQALRKIGKSVDRHMEGGRGRGYLEFIRGFFERMRN
jgi:hypothetical protein